MENNKKTFLFWALVIGIFLTIFLLWIPQFLQNVKTITTSLESQSTSQTSSFQSEWKARTEELKKNVDALLQQTQAITNTTTVSNTISAPVSPQESVQP